MKIIGYADFNGKSLEEQVDVAKKIGLDEFILRNIDDNLILDANINYKDLFKTLKNNSLGIFAIDPLILSNNINDELINAEIIKSYEKAINLANNIKVNNIIFRLPKINDIINEFELLDKLISPIIEEAKKNNKVLLIEHKNITTSNVAYILRKYNSKNLEVIFSPSDAILNHDSPLAGYRVLKNDFNLFIANDIDSINNPELLGYGRVDIIDIFKRMKRDKYRGNVMIDESFINLYNNKEIKKVPLIKKLFRRKSLFDEYMEGYGLRLFPNNKEQVPTIFDIYQNQIKIIKIVFNQ